MHSCSHQDQNNKLVYPCDLPKLCRTLYCMKYSNIFKQPKYSNKHNVPVIWSSNWQGSYRTLCPKLINISYFFMTSFYKVIIHWRIWFKNSILPVLYIVTLQVYRLGSLFSQVKRGTMPVWHIICREHWTDLEIHWVGSLVTWSVWCYVGSRPLT